jgi:plastocyanin
MLMKQDFAWRAVLGGLLGLLAGGAVMAAPVGKKSAAVKIDNFTFTSQRMTVNAGNTVTWVNNDDTTHVVVSSTKAFKSKALDTDDEFSFAFTTTGTCWYFCSPHPHMIGTIMVEEAAGRNAAP